MLKFYKTIFLFSSLFFSCNIINFEEVNLSSNLDSNNLYFNSDFIEINFSIKPNYDSIEKLLILKKDDSRIDLTYSWNEKKLLILPKDNWTKNSYYDLSLTGTILTDDNRNYEVKFKRSFYYGNPNDIFSIDTIILPTTNDKENKDIILNFNREINIFEFEKKFTIKPFTQITKEYFNNNMSVKISAQDNWQTNTLFEWELEQFNSVDKVILNKEYNGKFIGIQDLEIPKLIDIKAAKINDIITTQYELSDINDIKINNALAFIFNKEIDLSTFENSFSLEPKTQGHYFKDNNIIFFVPSENFRINTEYLVCIKETTKDLNSLSIYDDIFFTFTPTNDYLKIKNIKINKSENLKLFTSLNTIDKAEQINISSIGKLFVQVNFGKNIKQSCFQTIEKVISLESFFPTTLSYPKLEKVQWDSDSEVILQFSNLQSSEQEECFYKLKVNAIGEEFCSIDDEYLKESQCIVFLTR